MSHLFLGLLRRVACASLVIAVVSLVAGFAHAADVAIDLNGYQADCGISVTREGNQLSLVWPLEKGRGHVSIDLTPGQPLFRSLGVAAGPGAQATPILSDVEPVTFITVGTRQAPAGRPPEMSIWNTFFDKPGGRPHKTHLSQLDRKHARVTSTKNRATVAIGDLSMGPFTGELHVTLYVNCPLVHIEAVVSTEQDGCAILYDAGLASQRPLAKNIAWKTTGGTMERVPVDGDQGDRPVAVRHRAIFAESDAGSVACFPPPHQYHFPRDWTDNLKFAWLGRNHAGTEHSFGFGIRQVPDGGRAYEPWFNAPPGSQQRLGVFYLLSTGKAEEALEQTLRFTRGDRFPPLPGHITFTSHYHMAVAVTAMQRNFQWTPEFVSMFKQMGVNAVHLGEFHGDGHPKDPGPLRLPEMEAMFAECRRHSDGQLLVIPGEEINDFLGLKLPGKHPGHWMSLFPKPVYWIMQRREGEPFAELHPKYGTLYRVGSTDDMVELLARENGLAWAAHPRIKASSWTPDVFRLEPFYLSDRWLGGAWKHMPADLSRPKLGERVLDLLDDMANWGQQKYVLGEVDVFKLDHSHELFGHMNINYVQLDRLPRYDEGWQPIRDALRAGKFFVTTGEILLRKFAVGGKGAGETLAIASDEKPGVQKLSVQKPSLQVELDYTFPLAFAEIITGDGQQVYRERINLTERTAAGQLSLKLEPALAGRRWVRLEVWDIAANGAFTQPVWIERK